MASYSPAPSWRGFPVEPGRISRVTSARIAVVRSATAFTIITRLVRYASLKRSAYGLLSSALLSRPILPPTNSSSKASGPNASRTFSSPNRWMPPDQIVELFKGEHVLLFVLGRVAGSPHVHPVQDGEHPVISPLAI